MTEQPSVNGSAPEPQIQIPPMLAKVPTRFSVIELPDPQTGVLSPILIVNSVNGTFGFPIDPDPADMIGDALKASAAKCRTSLATPPSILFGPGGNPLSFG